MAANERNRYVKYALIGWDLVQLQIENWIRWRLSVAALTNMV